MITAPAMFRQEHQPTVGLRSLKKIRTRLAIGDTALALFAEQGYEATTLEQIAERAEISLTTFFRYFPSKASIILSDQDARLPALRRAILSRPLSENDLLALRHALREVWLLVIDPERTTRTAQAVSSSPVLRGLSYDIGQNWLRVVSETLARRHGRKVDERHRLTARTALTIFGETVATWVNDNCRYDLAIAVERNFDAMVELCGEWSRR